MLCFFIRKKKKEKKKVLKNSPGVLLRSQPKHNIFSQERYFVQILAPGTTIASYVTALTLMKNDNLARKHNYVDHVTSSKKGGLWFM